MTMIEKLEKKYARNTDPRDAEMLARILTRAKEISEFSRDLSAPARRWCELQMEAQARCDEMTERRGYDHPLSARARALRDGARAVAYAVCAKGE